MIMDIGDIAAVSGILPPVTVISFALSQHDSTLRHSLLFSWLARQKKQQFLKEPLAITLLCFCFMPAAFIWSPLSSRSDKSCSAEMKLSHCINTDSLWREAFSIKTILCLLSSFSPFDKKVITNVTELSWYFSLETAQLKDVLLWLMPLKV